MGTMGVSLAKRRINKDTQEAFVGGGGEDTRLCSVSVEDGFRPSVALYY